MSSFPAAIRREGLKALERSVHGFEQKLYDPASAFGELLDVSGDFTLGGGESRVNFVVCDAALGGVPCPGNGGFLYGFDEFDALFYAEYGEDTSGHDLVFGGEVVEVSVHGAPHESDDGSSVVGFLSDYLLEFRV